MGIAGTAALVCYSSGSLQVLHHIESIPSIFLSSSVARICVAKACLCSVDVLAASMRGSTQVSDQMLTDLIGSFDCSSHPSTPPFPLQFWLEKCGLSRVASRRSLTSTQPSSLPLLRWNAAKFEIKCLGLPLPCLASPSLLRATRGIHTRNVTLKRPDDIRPAPSGFTEFTYFGVLGAVWACLLAGHD